MRARGLALPATDDAPLAPIRLVRDGAATATALITADVHRGIEASYLLDEEADIPVRFAALS